MNKINAPNIYLRALRITDLDELVVVMDEPKQPLMRNEIQRWLHRHITSQNRNLARYAIIRRSDDALVGYCGLDELELENKPTFEIDYWIGATYRNQGLGSEAVTGFLQYCLSPLSLPRIVAIIAPDNHESIRVAQKAEMQDKGIIELRGNEVLLFEVTTP